MIGMAKTVLALDDDARATGGERVLDADFIAERTDGFPAFEAMVRATAWDEIQRASGLH